MRDHKQLRAFELADELALLVYRVTADFPRQEQFGLTAQLRRAAVSTASNIVEGCARHSKADYLRFLDIAHGSACEVEYQISLAWRLGYLDEQVSRQAQQTATETAKILNGLIRSLRTR
jgi:four helix bundle protein